VDIRGLNFIVTGVHQHPEAPPQSISPISDGLAYLRQLPQARSWAWSHLEISGSIDDLLESFAIGDNWCVGDGSFDDAFTSSAFSLVCATTDVALKGANIPPGFSEGQDAFPGELAGLYGMVFSITSLLEWKYGPQANEFHGMINISCDGESALNQAFEPDRYFTCRNPSSDLIIAIRRRIAEFPRLNWCYNHIYGHQDDDADAVLDEWAQQNVEMDQMAKEYRTKLYAELQGVPPQHPIDYAPWTVSVDGELLTKKVDKHLYDHCAKDMILEYWSQEERLRESTPTEVDWKALDKALRARNSGVRREMIKHSTGYFAHRKNQLRRRFWSNSKCPRCGAEVEDADHVVKCKSPEATKIWEGGMTGLRIKLRDTKTKPCIEEIIRECIDAWRNETPHKTYPHLP
jgi:hypothetical protein